MAGDVTTICNYIQRKINEVYYEGENYGTVTYCVEDAVGYVRALRTIRYGLMKRKLWNCTVEIKDEYWYNKQVEKLKPRIYGYCNECLFFERHEIVITKGFCNKNEHCTEADQYCYDFARKKKRITLDEALNKMKVKQMMNKGDGND